MSHGAELTGRRLLGVKEVGLRMLTSCRKIVLSVACVIGPRCLAHPSTANPQKPSPGQPLETTITDLIKSSAKFSGKHVRVFASFHTDGIERSVLLEPNCGLLDGTSKTPAPGGPQCYRGLAPAESDKLEGDPNNERLDQILKQDERSTRDKHITAEFTGIFHCKPSCASPKLFVLEIERLDKLEVVMKDLRPHRPN